MQFIDSHSHLDFCEFDADRADAIRRAEDAGVSSIIISSTTADRWQLVKQLCNDNSQICHPAYGLHPMFMNGHNLVGINKSIQYLKYWLEENDAVAIGEIGLDFFIQEADESNRKAQLTLFKLQLEIANDLRLPVIIHARKSLDIVLKHLRKYPQLTGSIHSFSGSKQQAEQLIDLGFYLSFGGPITYNRATRLHALIKDLPLENLLLETDAPDQPDADHHLQRNEPAYIYAVAEKIAELKGICVNKVAKQTTNNAKKLFRIID